MDGKNNGSFWPSYVDIMTTLFAITLILFAVSFSRFKVKERQLQLLVNEYEDIINVYSTVSSIESTKFFRYNSQYLKQYFTSWSNCKKYNPQIGKFGLIKEQYQVSSSH